MLVKCCIYILDPVKLYPITYDGKSEHFSIHGQLERKLHTGEYISHHVSGNQQLPGEDSLLVIDGARHVHDLSIQ
jgi:hypothetical protein